MRSYLMARRRASGLDRERREHARRAMHGLPTSPKPLRESNTYPHGIVHARDYQLVKRACVWAPRGRTVGAHSPTGRAWYSGARLWGHGATCARIRHRLLAPGYCHERCARQTLWRGLPAPGSRLDARAGCRGWRPVGRDFHGTCVGLQGRCSGEWLEGECVSCWVEIECRWSRRSGLFNTWLSIALRVGPHRRRHGRRRRACCRLGQRQRCVVDHRARDHRRRCGARAHPRLRSACGAGRHRGRCSAGLGHRIRRDAL